MTYTSNSDLLNEDLTRRETTDEWLRLALAAARIGTWEWNILTGEIRWSDNLEEIHGLTPGTFDGTFDTYLSIVHPEDRPAFLQSVETAIQEKMEFSQKLRILWPDRSVHWVLGKGRAFYDEAGQPVRMIGLGMDITDQVQAEAALRESEQRFRTLAEAMPQFVWVSDAEGNVEYVNPRWTAYTGQALAQTGQHDDSIIHPEDAPRMWAQWNAARTTGEDYEVEFRCRSIAEGSYRWFLARGVAMRDKSGQVVRWIGTSTDIEDQKQAEAQVVMLNNRLHRAVYESSHRIKNHLQTLAATVDMALLDGRPFIPADELHRLGAQIRTLSALQDILTLEWKSDTTGLVETITSTMLLGKVLEALQQTSRGHRLTFQVEEVSLPVRMATSLALTLNETVSNAVKHGRSCIEVTFYVENAMGRLEVCDDGPGFPDSFDPVSAANTGLELISALVAHDLRGSARYENREQGGARVVIVFPLLPEAASA